VPVKAAVTPPAAQNKPLPGEDVEAAKAVASFQATQEKAAKGTESNTQYYTLNGKESLDWKIT